MSSKFFLVQIKFRSLVGTKHYVKHYWLALNWTLCNKFQWNCHWKSLSTTFTKIRFKTSPATWWTICLNILTRGWDIYSFLCENPPDSLSLPLTIFIFFISPFWIKQIYETKKIVKQSFSEASMTNVRNISQYRSKTKRSISELCAFILGMFVKLWLWTNSGTKRENIITFFNDFIDNLYKQTSASACAFYGISHSNVSFKVAEDDIAFKLAI